MPVAFYADAAPRGFLDSLEEKAVSPRWKRLCVCPECGESWAVDEWDKYEDQMVTRVSNAQTWDEDSEETRKRLLQESRGGLDDAPCIWAGCQKKRVRGVVYCIDHLYATGARR